MASCLVSKQKEFYIGGLCVCMCVFVCVCVHERETERYGGGKGAIKGEEIVRESGGEM